MGYKTTLTEQEIFPTLPIDSIVHVKVDKVDVIELDGKNGKWEKLNIGFKVLGIQITGDGSDPARFDSMIGTTIFGSVPFRLNNSPDNQLRQWVEALLGMELGLGFELDTDLLERREARAIIGQYESKKYTDPVTGKPQKKHQVAQLLPKGGNILGGAAPAPAAAAQAQPEPQYAQPVGAMSIAPMAGGFDEEPPF